MSYTLNLETDEEAKEMQKAALILEGGAKRGVFTSGVLDYLMEQEYYIPHVIGVSAGSCNAVDYVSRQPGRTKACMIRSARTIDVSISPPWKSQTFPGVTVSFTA